MKIKLFFQMAVISLILAGIQSGCNGNGALSSQTVATVQRGDMEVAVDVDGNIEMPAAVNLFFDTTMFSPPYSARIKNIYVEKGQTVKAGALLAKLDDSTQILAVEAAQYSLELAMNNVIQTVCCGVTRVPTYYNDAVAFTRYDYAVREMDKAAVYFAEGDYGDLVAQIALAKYDIGAAHKFYSNPEYPGLRPEFNEFGILIRSSDDAVAVIQRLAAELDDISTIQQQIQLGEYEKVRESINALQNRMYDTHTMVKRISHQPGSYTFPDTCTTYTITNEVIESLNELQKLAAHGDADAVKFAETLSMAQHNLEISNTILDENISTFRQGLNLKALRDYNISIQSNLINLEKAKQALLKTELFAPFDGQIVDINLQAGDMITQRYSVTGVPIDSYIMRIVNTGSIKMAGIVDEIDVVKVKTGQAARIYVDSLPGKEFKGTVKNISPYGPQQSSGIQYFGTLQSTVATYEVEIAMNPDDAVYLTGGMTATAEILVDKRDNVLIVPNSAINGKNGDYSVRVLRNEQTNLIEQVPVEVGLQSRTQSEIISGLNQGDVVLLEKTNTTARSLNRTK
ncbi:MAG: HlyD family efflux transporter periplasmic adaptor subunit [Dehalococcoidia bacterium]|nr:HlyD family efflux transporter periplasmic adaptor subunit [Dehalococcoidia bacterium]MDD5493235.1 HlyD family efflux transporter periplasmic adaptor subunit [Dehalococcoidia bacterium]